MGPLLAVSPTQWWASPPMKSVEGAGRDPGDGARDTAGVVVPVAVGTSICVNRRAGGGPTAWVRNVAGRK